MGDESRSKEKSGKYGKYSNNYIAAYEKSWIADMSKESSSEMFFMPIAGSLRGNGKRDYADIRADTAAASAVYDAAKEAGDTKALGKLAKMKAQTEYKKKQVVQSSSYNLALVLIFPVIPFVALYEWYKSSQVEKEAIEVGERAEKLENAVQKISSSTQKAKKEPVNQQTVEQVAARAAVPSSEAAEQEATARSSAIPEGPTQRGPAH